ncbi:MAG TPA: ABC transporter ATP-binding protein [Bryobacteraceae bacterium]|nr:ABC transporter ATP-binding protein [Bryobacteraceae bacterium]
MKRPLLISSLTKSFPTPTGPHVAVKDFDVRIEPGEFVSLLGHSGCGKSTVLSIIAGLQNSTTGGIVIDGKEINGPSLDRALVFQSPSLLPWMTALENVMLAVSQAHPSMARSTQREFAMNYLDVVGVAEYAAQLPAELSQGTQQRVAIARAYSLEPRFLLLDEPFGALDSITRYELQDLLLDLWEQDPKTVIMVTHDVDEALHLCDRIIVMTDGPEAHLGLDLRVTLPRPRSRTAAVENPEYFRLRRQVIQFLEDHSRQFANQRAPVEQLA